MSTAQWSFEMFTDWLTDKAHMLRERGYIVELQLNDHERSSIRLRVESNTRVGELTVWNDGMSHEAVVDLPSGDFIHERDGFQLADGWASDLELFFERTMFTSNYD